MKLVSFKMMYLVDVLIYRTISATALLASEAQYDWIEHTTKPMLVRTESIEK